MKIKQILIVLSIVIFSSVISYRLGVLAQITGALKSIVEPGSMVTEASYVIFTDDNGNYFARDGNSGEIVFSGTNAATVIQSAINSLPTSNAREGLIYLKPGNYDMSTGITIGKRTYLIGTSPETTILVATANMNSMITIDRTNVVWTDWKIADLQVDMNNKNGDAIMSSDADENGLQCRMALQNLRLYNTNPGYCGINLTDVRGMDARNIRIRTPGGTGIKLRSSGGYNSGEGVWDNIIIGGAGTSNTVGIDIAGKVLTNNETSASNIALWSRIQLGGTMNYATGTIGLKIVDDFDITFYNLHAEGWETAVYIEGQNIANHYVENIEFYHPVIKNDKNPDTGGDPNNVDWRFVNKVRGVRIYGGSSFPSVNGKTISCDSLGSWKNTRPNIFFGHLFEKRYNVDIANGATRIVQGLQENLNEGHLEYQTTTASWTTYANPTGPVWDGRIVVVYSSGQPGYRMYTYANNDWRYQDLST